MLEHLDDPAPFDVDDGFRSRVRVRARALRARRRRVTAVASTALAAVSATTIIAVRPAGTDSAPVNVPNSTDAVETTAVQPATTTAISTTAVNVLIVGIDQTAPNDPNCPDASSCVDGPRTDTIVVARVDPTNHTLTLVPIPRDLWVRVGDHENRINTALTQVGPEGLVNAVTAALGIPIHHYVQVNFTGFRQIVDAIGGIRLSFSRPVRDLQTGLALETGCDHLDGATALAYVRSREFEYLDAVTGKWVKDPTSDLGRIRRAQSLLVGLVQNLGSDLSDPLALPRILDAITPNIVVDNGLTNTQLLDLARAVLQSQNAVSLPLTVDPLVGSSVLTLRHDDHNSAISRLLNGESGTVPPAAQGAGAEPVQAADGVVCR